MKMESEKAVAGEDSLMEVTQSTNDGEMTGQTSTSDGNALDSSSAVGNVGLSRSKKMFRDFIIVLFN